MPKGPKGEKRPADVIANAIKVARLATGEDEEEKTDEGKDAVVRLDAVLGFDAMQKVENDVARGAHAVLLKRVEPGGGNPGSWDGRKPVRGGAR